jgi:glycine cleavage system aminomethyltransferase T
MEIASTIPRDYQAATEAVALFDLSAYGKIELAGRDAAIFLHNLCTQDVKNLPVGKSVEAFLTTNKARVIAHVWVSRREENLLWLDMVSGQAEKVLKHLNHYLISEQVEVADRTQDFGFVRLVGPKVAVWLSAVLDQPLTAMAPLETRTASNVGMIRRQNLLALDGFDIFFRENQPHGRSKKGVGLAQREPQVCRTDFGQPITGPQTCQRQGRICARGYNEMEIVRKVVNEK